MNYGNRSKKQSETCRLKREARLKRIKELNERMKKHIEEQIEHGKVDSLMKI